MPKLKNKKIKSSKDRRLPPDVEPEQAVLPLAHSGTPWREELDEKEKCSYVSYG